jgi:LysM repeat protein
VNGIRGSRILVGEVLTIPLASSEGLLQYTVEEGESLWIIADRHGTTVEELRRANGISRSRIYPGQTLNVPFRF